MQHKKLFKLKLKNIIQNVKKKFTAKQHGSVILAISTLLKQEVISID
jgi:hypothetical protein